MVNLPRQIGVILLRALQNHLGAIGELMRGKVDLAEAAFADQLSDRVIPDRGKFRRRKLIKQRLVGVRKLKKTFVSGKGVTVGNSGRAARLALFLCSSCPAWVREGGMSVNCTGPG